MNAPRGTAGQSALETSLLVGVAVAAMVVMARYVQRGYQGYLYTNSASHGQQFDPRRPFEVRDQLRSFTQVQDIDVVSGDAAVNMFRQGSPSGGIFNDGSAPGGALPGRALGTKIRVETTWDFKRDGRYEAK